MARTEMPTGLLARTWRYGTQKKVRVSEQSRQAGKEFLVVVESAEPNETFVLVQAPGPDREPGTLGWIEFMRGGPTGGYWFFEPSA